MVGHRAHGLGDVHARLPLAQGERIGQRDLGRDIAAERIVRGRLVGHDIEPFPSPRPFGLDFRRVAHKSDRERLAVGRCPARERKCLIGRFRKAVDIADLESPPRSSRVDLDTDGGAAVHRDGQGLSATHATESGRQGQAAAQGPVEMLAG